MKSNRLALNARVRATAGDLVQLGEVVSGGSYLSQHDLRIHFGLGTHERLDQAEVLWPDGKKETLTDLAADRFYVVREGQGVVSSKPSEHRVEASLSMAIGATANRLRAVLLLAALFVAGVAAVRAQNTGHPAESPLMRQFHQALSLAEHGDKQGAMNLVLRLLQAASRFCAGTQAEGHVAGGGGAHFRGGGRL